MMQRIAVPAPVSKTPTRLATNASNFVLTNLDRSSARLFYGPDEACDYDWIEPGQNVRENGTWPELWATTKWSAAEVTLWIDCRLGTKGPVPTIGTTFKGYQAIELPSDGQPVQVMWTVVGVTGVKYAQDPRNHPDALVWLSTHIKLDAQGKPDGRNVFPLLHGQYLDIPGFNSAVWAWREPNPDISTVRIYLAKFAYGS